MNKTIFITGTNSGIGKATVQYMAQKGWNVAATVRDQSKHPNLFKEFKNVKLYDLDVTDYKQVQYVATKVIADFKKVDAIVNNAGYCLMGPTETSSMGQIEAQFKTNVFGVIAVSKAFIPHMRINNDGVIVNISSISAMANYPYIAAYGGSKWAVRGISESLGIELAPFGIEVKTIYPGGHSTNIFTKLDHGANSSNPDYKAYRPYYSNFIKTQDNIPGFAPPINIAKAIYKAVSIPKKGKLHLVSGRDAQLIVFMKKILSQRTYQKQQIATILKPMTRMQKLMFTYILGKNVKEVTFDIPETLID